MSPSAVACKAPWPLPNHHIPLFPHPPTPWSYFPKMHLTTFFFSPPFLVAIFGLHINAPISPHPHHTAPKQAKGIEVNLFSHHFFQIPAHGFLNLGLPQSLTHLVFLPPALGLFPSSGCQDLLRTWVLQERAQHGRNHD